MPGNSKFTDAIETATTLGYVVRSVDSTTIELVAPGYEPTIVVVVTIESQWHGANPEWRKTLPLVLNKVKTP